MTDPTVLPALPAPPGTPPATLADALAWVQANLPHVSKTKTAQVRSDKGNYSYKYADLPDIAKAIHPLLGQVGLAFICTPTIVEGLGFVMKYELRHGPSKQAVDGVYPLADPTRSTPQQIGSAITYARRYCLTSVTGLAADEDEDGQVASMTTASIREREEAAAKPAVRCTVGDHLAPEVRDLPDGRKVCRQHWQELETARLQEAAAAAQQGQQERLAEQPAPAKATPRKAPAKAAAAAEKDGWPPVKEPGSGG